MDPQIQQPVFLIEVDRIKSNSYQPRRVFDEEALKELSASIREFGVLQPLVVTKIEHISEEGIAIEYELIAGERRLLASKMAGLERVPAIIKKVSSDKERLELAMIENIQRSDLNPVDLAKAYTRLAEEFNLTQREIAVRLGKSREVVANSMRLLSLPTTILEALSQNKLNESQGRLLLVVSDPVAQQSLFEDILRNSLTVREVKNRVETIKRQKYALPQVQQLPDPEFEEIKRKFEESLGTPIHLEKTNQGGKITISFYSTEELNNILSRFVEQKNQPSVNASEIPQADEEPMTF